MGSNPKTSSDQVLALSIVILTAFMAIDAMAPIDPPARARTSDSSRNENRMLLREKPSARSVPISRLRPATCAFMVIVALIAPLISVAHPNDFNLLAARQAPSWNHLFGTTDQGSDIFSQVVLGARRSLLLGFAAGLLATAVAATLGVTAAYLGGVFDDVVNFLINVFLVIPAIPLLVVISSYLKGRGMWTMVVVLAAVLWAFEARILRGQALSLKSRDFVQAAKASGESTRRIVFAELMPNMISRIAAAFVLVFYIALLTDAGLEFLGLGDMSKTSWGVTLYWAQVVFIPLALAIFLAFVLNPLVRALQRRGLAAIRRELARKGVTL